jgi:hypothetical protein
VVVTTPKYARVLTFAEDFMTPIIIVSQPYVKKCDSQKFFNSVRLAGLLLSISAIIFTVFSWFSIGHLLEVGITLYAIDEHKRVHVRTFFIAGRDVLEDPVCGSGNAAVALHIKQTGKIATVGQNYEALQGKYMNRDGHIFAKIGDDISIGGRCHTIFDGQATP